MDIDAIVMPIAGPASSRSTPTPSGIVPVGTVPTRTVANHVSASKIIPPSKIDVIASYVDVVADIDVTATNAWTIWAITTDAWAVITNITEPRPIATDARTVWSIATNSRTVFAANLAGKCHCSPSGTIGKTRTVTAYTGAICTNPWTTQRPRKCGWSVRVAEAGSITTNARSITKIARKCSWTIRISKARPIAATWTVANVAR
jgi:hypothetical protein